MKLNEFSKQSWVLAICLMTANAICTPALHAQGSSGTSTASSPKVKPEFQIDIMQMRAKFANRVPSIVASAQAPAGFPVPVYSYNALSANFNQSTSPKYHAVSGTILTKDEPQVPYEWYKRFFSQNGWTMSAASEKRLLSNQQGKVLSVGATKDKVSVSVSCIRTGKAPYSIVNISTATAIVAPAAK